MQRKPRFALAAIAVLAAANSVFASTYYWGGTNGVAGTWSDPDWLLKSGGAFTPTTAIPGDTAGDSAVIGSNDGASNGIVTLAGTAGATGQLTGLSVGTVGGTGLLNLSTGTSITTSSTNFIGIGSSDNTSTGTPGTGTINQTGGTFNGANSYLFVGGNDNAGNYYGAGTYSISGGSATFVNTYFGIDGATGELDVSGTGTFTSLAGGDMVFAKTGAVGPGVGNFSMTGGTVQAVNLQFGAGAGASSTANMSGGLVTWNGSTKLSTIIGNSGTATFNMSGGTLGESGKVSGLIIGYDSGSNGTLNVSGTAVVNTFGNNSAGSLVVGNSGAGTMNVTGGTVNVNGSGSFVEIGAGTNGVGTLTISGGTFNTDSNAVVYIGFDGGGGSTGTMNIKGGTLNLGYLFVGLGSRPGGTLNVVGSAAAINVAGQYFQNPVDTTAFYLDDGGVSAIHAASANLGGTLKAGFVGGAALLASPTATIITCPTANTISNNYDTMPNTSMWTPAKTNSPAPATYTISLAAASDKTALDATVVSESSFTATGFGHLVINNVNTGSPFSLYLDADAGTGKTLADLVNFFDTNTGLTAAAVSPAGTDFDMELTFATPSAATQYFGWDLSDFNSDATLSGIGFVPSGPANLFFTGSTDGNWDASTTNFTAGSGAVAYSDATHDNVTFDDSVANGGHNTGQFTIAVQSGGVSPTPVTVSGTTNYTFNGGSIGGASTLAKSGSSTLVLNNNNTYSGNTTVTGGTLEVGPAGSLPSGNNLTVDATSATAAVKIDARTATGIVPVTLGNVNLVAGGTLSAASVTNPGSSTNHGNRMVLVANSLSNAGNIDLGGNDLIVHGGSLSAITEQLAAGFNDSGYWNGTANGSIRSSAAAADTTFLTTLGVALVNSTGTLGGDAVTAGDVLVKYTYYGDADLSGKVDGTDYSLIDVGYNSQTGDTPLAGWINGDFNYDGHIDGSDYSLIDNAFNMQGSNGLASPMNMIAVNTSEIAGASAVPEPGSLMLLGMGAMGLLSRRRRRK